MIVSQCSMTNVCSVPSLNEIKIKWLQGIKKQQNNMLGNTDKYQNVKYVALIYKLLQSTL